MTQPSRCHPAAMTQPYPRPTECADPPGETMRGWQRQARASRRMSERQRLPKEGKVLEIWNERVRRKKKKEEKGGEGGGVLSLVIPHAAPGVAGGSKTPCGDTRRPPILNDLAALMYEFGCIRPGESEPSETLLLHAFACFRSF